jgi:hypothetical protein
MPAKIAKKKTKIIKGEDLVEILQEDDFFFG